MVAAFITGFRCDRRLKYVETGTKSAFFACASKHLIWNSGRQAGCLHLIWNNEAVKLVVYLYKLTNFKDLWEGVV